MRLALALLAALCLAGCTWMGVDSPTSTVTRTETLHDGPVALGPEPGASVRLTVEVPANTSWLQVDIGADHAVNLRAEGPDCATGSGSGNVQIGIEDRQTAGMRCDAPRAGPFTIVISRDSGAGDVDVVVQAMVTRTTTS